MDSFTVYLAVAMAFSAKTDLAFERMDRGLKENNDRIDRMLYGMIALGGGLVALLIMRVLEG